LPSDTGDPPDLLSWPTSTPTSWQVPPPNHPLSGLPPDCGLAFELRIKMPRSRPMKRWSKGELDECRKQVAFLLDQGWIVPYSASASVVFAGKPDGTWRSCQDFRGLNAITQRSVEPLPLHAAAGGSVG
jgi:hypothetical protein